MPREKIQYLGGNPAGRDLMASLVLPRKNAPIPDPRLHEKNDPKYSIEFDYPDPVLSTEPNPGVGALVITSPACAPLVYDETGMVSINRNPKETDEEFDKRKVETVVAMREGLLDIMEGNSGAGRYSGVLDGVKDGTKQVVCVPEKGSVTMLVGPKDFSFPQMKGILLKDLLGLVDVPYSQAEIDFRMGTQRFAPETAQTPQPVPGNVVFMGSRRRSA